MDDTSCLHHCSVFNCSSLYPISVDQCFVKPVSAKAAREENAVGQMPSASISFPGHVSLRGMPRKCKSTSFGHGTISHMQNPQSSHVMWGHIRSESVAISDVYLLRLRSRECRVLLNMVKSRAPGIGQCIRRDSYPISWKYTKSGAQQFSLEELPKWRNDVEDLNRRWKRGEVH